MFNRRLADYLYGGRMNYIDPYDPTAERKKGDVVRDGQWLMVALVDTPDRAAPQDVGPPQYSTDLTDVLTESIDASIVTVEHTYTLATDGYMEEILLQTPFWDTDSVTKVEMEVGSSASARENLILRADTWESVAQGQEVLTAGTVIKIRFSQYQAAAANVISGGWTSIIGTGVPAFQQFNLESVLLAGTITIDHTDLDSVSRTTELRGVGIGSTITLAETADSSRSTTIRTTTIDTTNTLGYSTFAYNVISSGATGPVRTNRTTSVRVDVPIAVSTRYATNLLEFAVQPAFATVTTKIYYDGVDQVAAVTTGYGINIRFQEAVKSDDWAVLSAGGSGGAGSASGTAVSILQNRSAGWRDNLAALVGAAKGAGAPALAAFGPTGNVKQLKMGIGDSVYVNWHVNHDILRDSLMYFHVHWATDGTQANSVKWRIKYIEAGGHNTDNFGAEVNIDLEEAAQGTAWRHMITEDATGVTTPGVDSVIIVEIERISNGGTNNTDEVFILFADIHYEVDRYATVSRSPDFYS